MKRVLFCVSVLVLTSLGAACGAQSNPSANGSSILVQAGDLLFYQKAGVIDSAIRTAEGMELSSNLYSHVAIYLGEREGVPEVAEMLTTGHVTQPLDESIAGAVRVDVFRRQGIDSTKGAVVASKARLYRGIPYAFSQIEVLGLLAGGCANPACRLAFLPSALSTADRAAGGKRQMICSEMVAWAYYDANVDWAITVIPWPSAGQHGLCSTLERRMDYTTPNMLALSPDLVFVGQLR